MHARLSTALDRALTKTKILLMRDFHLNILIARNRKKLIESCVCVWRGLSGVSSSCVSYYSKMISFNLEHADMRVGEVSSTWQNYFEPPVAWAHTKCQFVKIIGKLNKICRKELLTKKLPKVNAKFEFLKSVITKNFEKIKKFKCFNTLQNSNIIKFLI